MFNFFHRRLESKELLVSSLLGICAYTAVADSVSYVFHSSGPCIWRIQDNGICILSQGLSTPEKTVLCLWRHSSREAFEGALNDATTTSMTATCFAALAKQNSTCTLQAALLESAIPV